MDTLRNLYGLLLTFFTLFEVSHEMKGIRANALVKYTAFLDRASGALSGTVFAFNKGGNYVRGKGQPLNPNTPAQSLVKARFATIAQSWRNLSQEKRDAWNASTDDYPYQNRMGDTKTLSGFGLHQKLNLNLGSVDAAFITLPLLPTNLRLPPSISVIPSLTDGTMIVSANYATMPGQDTSFAVFATESSSAGRANLKNRLRQITVIVCDDLGGKDIYGSYTAIFGTPVRNAKIGFTFKPVENNTGQGSAEFYSTATVV